MPFALSTQKLGKTQETTFADIVQQMKRSPREGKKKNNEVTPNGCTGFLPGSTPETIVEWERTQADARIPAELRRQS